MSHAHVSSAMVEVSAARAFDYLTSIEGFRRWSLGCLQTLEDSEGRWHGRSLFDGAGTWCRLDSDPMRRLIDFHVGSEPGRLQPRINARVIPGPVLGRDEHHCLLTLTAYRSADMTDARWQRLRATHDCEIHLIKAQLESEAEQGARDSE